MKRHKFNLVVNDTDSISFCRNDGKPITKKQREQYLNEINSLMKPGVIWEDDDYFKTVIAVGAKNYILVNEKVKIKGSALKATKKEPALKVFINEFINLLINEKLDDIPKLYLSYVKRILDINEMTDISEWCFKVTATKKVLAPTTIFNNKVFKALAKSKIDIVEGDKYYMYFKPAKIKMVKDPKTGKDKKKVIQYLSVRERYKDNICKMTLLKKLFVTAKIFHRVYDITKLPNMTLKKNQKLLSQFNTKVSKK